MTEAENVLTARHMRVRFGGVTALDLDQFDIPAAGQVAALLMGPNGAGKTTFIDALSGFVAPAAGASILLSASAPVDIAYASRVARVRAGVVRTFQRPPVFGSLTVGETIGIAAAVWLGRPSRRANGVQAIESITEAFDVANVLSRPTQSLPLHLLRRVELARLFVTQPRLLLLDEPTAGSDDREREYLATLLTHTIPPLIAKLHAENAYRFGRLTTCVVTHDLKFARELARGNAAPVAHIFGEGRIRASGDLSALLSNPELRASYFGGG